MNAKSLCGVGLAFGLWAGGAAAEEVVWRPVKERPAAALGHPRPIVVRAQSADVPPIPPVPGPSSGGPYGGYPYPGGPSGPVAPPPAELYNQGVVPDCGPVPGGGGWSFWDRCRQLFDLKGGPLCAGGRRPFQSDHAFDQFISPVSNPFLFEDPRSLTELRPVFIYQTIPKKNAIFPGGNIEYYGVQARVALTDHWSIVMSKLGGVSLNPNDPLTPGFEGGNSFAELNIGPKWTFIRSDRSGTVGALGVQFQIPVGGKQAFQDTGMLSVVPYFTIAQTFGRSSYGSFNVLGTVGYALATDNRRSDALFAGLHLDYDVANLHKIYPLLELNWTHYAADGGERPLAFEGRDLFNFGSTNVSGGDSLSIAAGLRYKFNEHVQFGAAVEFPLTGRRDVQDFRVTLDLIFRF